METDFSHVNLEYFVHARDLARQDPCATALLLDMPAPLATSLATATPGEVTRLARMKTPLLIPRYARWWWVRLFQAVRDGNSDEIETVMAHASLCFSLTGEEV